MTRPLLGKRALVTGASSALGAGIAARLAEDGARVCLHGRNEQRLEEQRAAIADAGADVCTAAGSLSDDASARAVFDAAEDALGGGIDILVNNAGGEAAGNAQAPWLDASPDEWVATYNSNVASMVRLIQAAVPGMKSRGWGRLIQLSSASVDTPLPIIPDYQAAKSAIRSLTRSLAMSLAHTGITANSVSPGLTLSDGPEAWLKRIAEEAGWGDDRDTILERANTEMANNFAGRIGVPADIAHAVSFLADPRADMVNAIDIRIDGGR